MTTSRYDFKMVQLPQTFVLKQDTGKEIAAYLQQLSVTMSAEGWEYYRVDSVGVAVSPGCWASLMGAKQSMTYYNVVTFRRLKQHE